MKIVLKLEITLLKTAMQLQLGNLNSNSLVLKESTEQTFKLKVEKKLTLLSKKKGKLKNQSQSIPSQLVIILYGKLVKMVLMYLKAVSSRCAAVNTNIAYCNSKNPYSKVPKHCR